jgi:hypothetical protein
MRTTIRLDDALLQEAKRAAADSGKTLTALIEESVRERLARRRSGRKRRRIRLPSFKGSGVRPGVDLNDSAALLDLMEGPRGPLRR